jgi:hypothetical protein
VCKFYSALKTYKYGANASVTVTGDSYGLTLLLNV